MFFGIVNAINSLYGSPYFQCWSLSILCRKVCELVQLVTTRFLAQSLKWLEVKPTKTNPNLFDNLSPWFSNWSFQIEISLTSNVFLPPLLDFVLLHLPLTNPSMLWCFQRIYHWFIVAQGKTTTWTSLENFNLLTIPIIGKWYPKIKSVNPLLNTT
jgi:hypothetical protein